MKVEAKMNSLIEDEDYSPDIDYDIIKCNKTPEEIEEIFATNFKEIVK